MLKMLVRPTPSEYQGHILSPHGIQVDPSKIQAMVDWPTPTSITALRGFLGLTSFCRKFICNYASIASPLTNLLKKDSFKWNTKAQLAFSSLKSATPLLPSFPLPIFPFLPTSTQMPLEPPWVPS